MKVVLPGGSGFIGRSLGRHLESAGHEIVVLSRSGESAVGKGVAWDGKSLGPWAREVDGADVVVNLAGRSVNCRYNEENKRQIMGSRVDSTRVLGEAIGAATNPPRVWLNSSTATIYRDARDHAQDELTGEIGAKNHRWKFSIDVATAWERTFFEALTPGVRKVALRSAMVMGVEQGGPFAVMLGLARKGLGGTMAGGEQMVSWVHERDFNRAIEFLALESDLDGIVNIASPGPLPNRDFFRAIREAADVKIGLPAPAWLLELGAVFIKTETELILKSRWVVPTRLTQAGFTFEFQEWRAAAGDLVAHSC